MKFGNSVADIFIIKHTQIWLGWVRICHFYRTLSSVTVFSWTQCIQGGPARVRPTFILLVTFGT